MNHLQINDAMFDYLIARSGIVGRQILKLCRFIHREDHDKFDRATGLEEFWLRQRWLRRLLEVRGVSRLLNVFYTYYIGGSLTRSDQVTFAKLHGMGGNAYRLTLFNAIFCGIPCALGYFVLGEGFSLLKGVHSYAELPSLLAQHTSLGVGLTSLSVDLFRAVDSFWHRRCWAPFGFLPLAINIPTYFKRLFQNGKHVSEKSRKTHPDSDHHANKRQIDITNPESTNHADGSDDYISEKYPKTDQAISHSR
jgi:hypothetical protein